MSTFDYPDPKETRRIYESIPPLALVLLDRDAPDVDLTQCLGGYDGLDACEPTFELPGALWLELTADPVPHWRIRPIGYHEVGTTLVKGDGFYPRANYRREWFK